MLNIGNRIKYNNTIYRIVGINFSTYYLRADNSTSSYDYDMFVRGRIKESLPTLRYWEQVQLDFLK